MPVLKQPKAPQNIILKNVPGVIGNRSMSSEAKDFEFGSSHLTYTNGGQTTVNALKQKLPTQSNVRLLISVANNSR